MANSGLASVAQRETGSARWWRWTWWLALFTIFYNIAEGIVSVWWGLRDEALTLFGFGLDSFIECLSGAGIAFMVLRLWRSPSLPASRFERLALQTTAVCFFLLAAALAITAVANIVAGQEPTQTWPGVVISLVSILIMWALVRAKEQAARALDSRAIMADAGCARVCMYMSLVLMASSFVYATTGWPFVDAVGALGLAWLSIQEGREAWAHSRGDMTCLHHCHDHEHEGEHET